MRMSQNANAAAPKANSISTNDSINYFSNPQKTQTTGAMTNQSGAYSGNGSLVNVQTFVNMKNNRLAMTKSGVQTTMQACINAESKHSSQESLIILG